MIAVEGDQRLFNQYGVILVNPAKHPHVKKEMGQAFIDWVISPEGQRAIAEYKIGGEQLFFPNAKGEMPRYRGLTLRVLGKPPPAMGPGKAELVERIGRTGSISAAARDDGHVLPARLAARGIPQRDFREPVVDHGDRRRAWRRGAGDAVRRAAGGAVPGHGRQSVGRDRGRLAPLRRQLRKSGKRRWPRYIPWYIAGAMDLSLIALLASGMLVAAFLYASVGHGGASAYIAAMAIAGIAPAEMRPIALQLNVLVSALATYKF